jgi:hypothetical protein
LNHSAVHSFRWLVGWLVDYLGHEVGCLSEGVLQAASNAYPLVGLVRLQLREAYALKVVPVVALVAADLISDSFVRTQR